VFDRLGYNPDVGVEIFNGLCTALAEQRLAHANTRQLSGRDTASLLGEEDEQQREQQREQQEERDVAEILAERNSVDDEVPALMTHFPLANALVRTVTSTYNAATQDKDLGEFLMTKMDVADFVAACELDDVLIQAIQLRPRKRMLDFVAKKQEEARHSQEGE
jgi:hypothetical protein